jgi:hypothetical protein
MERRLRETNQAVSQQIHALRREIEREFGSMSRVVGGLLGPLLVWTSRREHKRLARGQVYEPAPVIERSHWASA